MSRLERAIGGVKSYLAEKKEQGRLGRMADHPHFDRCDGSGDIVVIKVDKFEFGDPRMPSVFGTVRQCTSCEASEGYGTLRGEGNFDQP